MPLWGEKRYWGRYAETAAYVARILALLDGAGALLAPPLEVSLVK